MRLTPQLVMLTVAGVTGSVLFAAEANRQIQQRAVAMAPAAEVDKDKKLPNATDTVTGKPTEPTQGDAKRDAAKTDAAKADAKVDATKDAAPEQAAAADKAADKTAADKGAATTAKSSKTDADRAATPQRFLPSEEVRADFDVSFPVDI